MNIKFSKYSIALLAFAAVFNSCTGDFEELNTRPDALVASSLDASMVGPAFAQSQYHGLYGEHWRFQIAQSLFADLYCQYFATTQVNFDSDRYTQVGGWSDAAWTSFYQMAAPQIKFVEDYTAEHEMPLENAIVKIWKVEAYHRITDYWGPIVYSQFGNQKSVVPYDSQEEIYRSFFVTLDEATTVLKQYAGKSVFPSHDQIFNGSVDKWLVFANSLRLRLAMRVKYVDAALAKTQAEKAVSDGVMVSNDDNAMLTPTINSRNPYWTITDWGEFRMSAAMESVLKGYDDPRAGEYFSPAVDGDDDGDGFPYEGLRNGLAKVDINGPVLNPQHSDMAPLYLNDGRGGPAAGAPMRVMCSAEVYFLRAEGALTGWAMGGTVEELYNKGIEMSLKERTAATAGEIAAYIASTSTPAAVLDVYNTPPTSDIPVAFDAAGSAERKLEQIITQKWIALYPDGWEAWTELRRTGYPKLYDRLNSDNVDVPKNAIMRRLIFVTSEYTTNSSAVKDAVALPEIAGKGGDKNSTHLWWDAK
ncbi:MAG TPA: SusD/RagB family nutrient-binding outer membrane lipoprotein [Chryseosolibacter sp.]